MSKVTRSALWQFAKSTHLRKRLREEFGISSKELVSRLASYPAGQLVHQPAPRWMLIINCDNNQWRVGD